MSIVQLEYDCPVGVVVNTDTGKVEKVIVWDEDIGETLVRAYLDGNTIAVTNPIVPKAQAIAREADWPAWQVGL